MAQVILYIYLNIYPIFSKIFLLFIVCFINFNEYGNSTIRFIGINVKLLSPCITIRPIIVSSGKHVRDGQVFVMLLIDGYFCEYTLFFRITLGVGVETM